MLCKQCGFNHGSQVNFCPACGHKISEEDRQEYLAGNHSAKGFKILFGFILAGLALSIYLILFSDNITKAVSEQLQAIKDNRLTEAYYNYSSKGFQKEISLENFRQFLQHYPFFSHYESVRFIDRENDSDTAHLQAMMMTNQGVEIPVEFDLVKEGDKWLVDGIGFEDSAGEKIPDGEGVFDDQPLRSAINGLMEQIRQRNLTKAYQEYTSSDFQKTTSFKDFEEFVKENSDFSNHRDLVLNDLSFDNNIATLKGTLTGSDGKLLEVEYDLIEENGTWKIFHVQLNHSNHVAKELQFFQLTANADDIQTKKETLDKTTRINAQPLLDVVEEQLKLLRAMNIEEAYIHYTSKEFRQKTSLQDFEKLVSKYKILANNNLFQFQSFYIENDIVTIGGELHSKDGEIVPVEFDFIKVDSQWKIMGIQIYQNETALPSQGN